MFLRHFFVAFIVLLLVRSVSAEPPKFEEFKPNRPVLDLPVTDKKMVLAHFMTGCFVRDPRPGDYRDRFLSYEDFAPDGITAHLGGESQILPIDYYFNFEKSSVEAAAFHIRAAKKVGIDGFQFFYPFPPNERFQNNFDNIIIDFFNAAETVDIDFNFSLCICTPPAHIDEDEKIAVFAKGFRRILDAVGKGNRFWAKTPDGRFLTHLWHGDALANAVREAGGDIRGKADAVIPRIAFAYEKLGHAIGIDLACAMYIRYVDDQNYVDRVLEYFPIVWNWTENLRHEKAWFDLAKRCKEQKRAFMQGVYPDYYGSKLYRKGDTTWSMFHFLHDVKKLSADEVEHDYYYSGVTDIYLNYLNRMLETDSPLVSFITYNDYQEGHHAAPELNHNFGFAILFNHYKNIWLGTPEKNDKEFAVLAYKKYRHDIVPEPFNIVFLPKVAELAMFDPSTDDFINIVVFLKQPATVFLNGKEVGTAKGTGDIEVFKVPLAKGRVKLEIKRNNEPVITLAGTEWITDKPFRTDRLTYYLSSECDNYYAELFGKDAPRYFLQQYVEDADGVPYWKKGKSVGVRYADGTIGTATTIVPGKTFDWP